MAGHGPLRVGDRMAAAVRRTDAMLVTGDRRRYVRVLVTDLFLFLFAVAAWSGHWIGSPPVWFLLVASTVVGMQLGRTGIMTIRRANAYRAGWLHGRSAFVSAMVEAERRGMTPAEWLEGELARDWHTLGMEGQPPIIREPPP